MPSVPDMPPLLITACLWVFAAALTALLPIRVQKVLGLGLLIAAAGLLWMIWRDLHPVAAVLALAAVVSMFRRPLAALLRRVGTSPARGQRLEGNRSNRGSWGGRS